jgi:hypothetical protein
MIMAIQLMMMMVVVVVVVGIPDVISWVTRFL